tara:strand:- start:1801 stop:2829 length:1029 start_codon:yes stop_codon:yes gene_type:complete
MKKTLSFDDVLLVPSYSDIKSRGEVDLSVDMGGNLNLSLPIIASPMDSVSEDEMALAMADAGGISIIHRYNTIERQVELIKRVIAEHYPINVGAAVGVTGDYLERAYAIRAAGVNTICVDIAHGHHTLMKEALDTLRNKFNNSLHIMAGNVATLEGFNDLADWGADSIRVGIGGGSICSTRIQTGHGVPTLQSVMDCAKSDRDARLIADGGIKTSGDVVKALAAGADAVMLGSMLAGTDETPGGVFVDKYGDGLDYKVYRGMASRNAQMDWRGKSSSPEGISTTVRYKGPVLDVLQDLTGGIKSGFSYSGARTLSELHAKAEFIRQTLAGQSESNTHILSRR